MFVTVTCKTIQEDPMAPAPAAVQSLTTETTPATAPTAATVSAGFVQSTTGLSTPTPGSSGGDRREVMVDFLFLDLTTCARCVGTDRNLETALDAVRGLVQQTGVTFEVRRHLVTSAEMARQLRFVSSPTLRVNGRDIAVELQESTCGSEPCTDGCGEGIDCRVWTHDGQEHTQAPVGLIIDALLREIYAPTPGPAADAEQTQIAQPTSETDYELPDNLRRFFAGRETPGKPTRPGTPAMAGGPPAVSATQPAPAPGPMAETTADVSSSGCCTAPELEVCCAPAEKSECCGASTSESCGCQ